MENAKVGFGKLFTAEILAIIGSFITLVSKDYWYIGIIFIVVDIVAFFMNLKGLKLMGKDLEGYNKAYKFALAGIAIDIITLILCFVFNGNTEAGTILNNTSKALSNAIELAICYLVLKTSIAYLESKGNTDLAAYAKTTKNLLVAAYAICIILEALLGYKTSVVALIGIVGALVALVCMLTGQIKYILFLKKMKNAL